MTLPKRPPLNQPIPNADIPNAPRQYSVKAPYWDAVVSGDLAVTEDGKLEIQGSTTPPLGEVEVRGEYWNMPLGNGLGVYNGEFRNIEPDLPPYECRTAVFTYGVTDFTDAWRECTFTSFPDSIDTSTGTDFTRAWYHCENLTEFPTLDFSSGENFTYSWAYTGLTSFPKLNTSNGSIFYGTWCGCYYMTEFPELDLSKGEDFTFAWYGCSDLTSFPGTLDLSSGVDFNQTWVNCTSLTSFPGTLDLSSGTDFISAWNSCTSLTSFPAGMFDSCSATNFAWAWQYCALNQTSVDNILVSINAAGQSNGFLSIDGGTSAAPSATGLAAKASLQGRGWTVLTN